jgi:conjugative transfer signal peptidase TraF
LIRLLDRWYFGLAGALLTLILAYDVDAYFSLPGPRVNLSESIPVGLYWFTPGTAAKGQIVVACLPESFAQEERRAANVSDGTCPSGIQPVAKVLAATAPDVVTFARDGVRINGALWPMSGRISLAPFFPPSRAITLAPGQAVLLGLHSRSWDSRYFGTVDDHAIIGTWSPLITSKG